MIKTVCDICGKDITDPPMMSTWCIEVMVSDERARAERTFNCCQEHIKNCSRLDIINQMFNKMWQSHLKEKT